MYQVLAIAALAAKYAIPVARLFVQIASDGKVERGEAIEVIKAIWPVDEVGKPVAFKIPFYGHSQ